jgi:hypothetical protein
MRCTNSGSGYDNDDVEWTCKASLPPEFKLGSTDVICEGYKSPDDPYILKGSCGVEYRLVLTEQGEEKFGKKSWWDSGEDTYRPHASTKTDRFVSGLFWLLFVGVACWMIYGWVTNRAAARGGANPNPRPRGGWGGGGGGGDDNDPPPPYDPRPPPGKSYGTSTRPAAGWTPGFWTGTLGGAAAGYMMGNRGQQNQNNRYNQGGGWFGGGNTNQNQAGGGWFGGGNGEGSSGSRRSGGGSGPTPSSSRYESTGFGSTRRR